MKDHPTQQRLGFTVYINFLLRKVRESALKLKFDEALMSKKRIAELEIILLSYIEKYGQTDQTRRYFISMTDTKRLKAWRFPPIWGKKESAKEETQPIGVNHTGSAGG